MTCDNATTVLTLSTGRTHLLAAALAAVLGTGCAAPRAQVAAEPPPPLMVPPPPPRIIVPPDPTLPRPAEEAPAPVAPARPRPPRPAAPRTDPKVEPPKPVESDPAKAANGQETPPPPAPTLEMQPGAGDVRVRQQLDKALADLGNVNYAALSRDLKIQYDTAKRFITLGEQALREQNLMFAATLADKAGAIATLLLRR